MARSHCAEGVGEKVFCKIHIWFNKMSAVDTHVLFFLLCGLFQLSSPFGVDHTYHTLQSVLGRMIITKSRDQSRTLNHIVLTKKYVFVYCSM